MSAHFTSYHAVLGAELGNRASIVRLAVEGQLTTVPKAFGTTGAAGAFDEHNLGGFQLRLKILAGR